MSAWQCGMCVWGGGALELQGTRHQHWGRRGQRGGRRMRVVSEERVAVWDVCVGGRGAGVARH
eukprot:362622-Chlamydomonas_euryale.AAC.9